MNQRLFSFLLICFALPLCVYADEPAEVVRTSGAAKLERVSNFLVFSSSTKTAVRVPGVISVGDSVRVQYVDSGKTIETTFPVVEISIRGNLCWLHSKQRTQYDTSLGDTIYVEPCNKVR